jgi:hypothetical protein
MAQCGLKRLCFPKNQSRNKLTVFTWKMRYRENQKNGNPQLYQNALPKK